MSLPVLYLNYHEVRAEPSDYLYSLPSAEFAAHMRAVAAPPSDARIRLGVTFDDGHITHFEQAYPILGRAGVEAIFFVTAGFTGTEPSYMSWAQLRELAGAGHEIAAHGWLHRFFTHCSAAELDEELRRPKQTIEDRVGRSVDALSFPGGRFDDRVLEACGRAGYRRVFTSEPWPPVRTLGGLTLYGRFGVNLGMTAQTLQRLMQAGGRPSPSARLKHGLKRTLRAAIGDERYHRLWCLLAKGDPGAERNAAERR